MSLITKNHFPKKIFRTNFEFVLNFNEPDIQILQTLNITFCDNTTKKFVEK